MKLSLMEMSKLFPLHRGAKESSIFIHDIMTDSRKKGEKSLFIPIVGENFDGHNFLKDAIYNGAIAAIWQENKEVPSFVPSSFPLFFVKDSVEALQTLAGYYLKEIKPIVIAITGSNGKTTTKDLVDAVLRRKYKTHKTAGNYNNHIGLPLTILSMPEQTEVIILEMGMSNFGEISLLSRLAQPSFSIITNIGESHIEYLGSRAGIASAKLEITDGMEEGLLIIDGDEPLLKSNFQTHISTICCGFSEENDVKINQVTFKEEHYSFTVNGEEFDITLLGKHNVKNATYAIVVALKLGISVHDIKAALLHVDITKMRLERALGKNQTFIINDAYNASPTSMKAAINTMKDFSDYRRKVVVLGDMYELGPDEENMHRSVADAITAPITDVITIGEKGNWIADELRTRKLELHVYSFLRKEEALPFITELLSPYTVILFKASRGAKLESLINEIIV